jgi:hypothetical protein
MPTWDTIGPVGLVLGEEAEPFTMARPKGLDRGKGNGNINHDPHPTHNGAETTASCQEGVLERHSEQTIAPYVKLVRATGT